MTTPPLNVYSLRARGAAREVLVAAGSMEAALSLFLALDYRHHPGPRIPEQIQLVGELEAVEPQEPSA